MIRPRRPLAPRAVARHYDELDPFYRAVWGEHLHHGLWERGDETVEQAVEALVRRVADEGRIGPGSTVCDVGCGYGGTAQWLAERRGARVLGLTLSAVQAEVARARLAEAGVSGVEIRMGDWLANGLEAESFDVALALESTTHMPDRPRVFAELARVLRPGGRLVACIWLSAERPGALARRLLLEPICSEGRLEGLASASENRAWIEASGLTLERCEDLSAKVARTWSVCVGRVARALVRDPAYRRFLFDGAQGERIFARTLVRLWLAYRTGAMEYGLFVARKP
jgi:tocopherol O-methyltransferase